tara:strand:- start:1857 stop:2705 length:849 start_codon:yes stop_codon:yes gene_type:complete
MSNGFDIQNIMNPDGSINQDAYNQLGISAYLPTPGSTTVPAVNNTTQTADNTITPLTQPSYSTTQDNTAFDFNNSVDKFNLQNTFQPWGNNFPDIQTGPGFDAVTDNFGQRNFSTRAPIYNTTYNKDINTNVNDTNLGLLNAVHGPPDTRGNMPQIEMDEETWDESDITGVKPGMFGKPSGFGSGQGWFSRIGQGGDGFMGKFGTKEGFGGKFGTGRGLLARIGTYDPDIPRSGETFGSKFGTGHGALANMDWGAAGKAIGGGLQKMAANMGQGFQYGQYGG